MIKSLKSKINDKMKKLIPPCLKYPLKTILKEGIIKSIKIWRDEIDRKMIKYFSNLYTQTFHKLYYYSETKTWQNTYWLGIPVQKCPLDLWIYQEIIYETKPEIIIETGTAKGGSALFLASLCELIKKGEIITIDISDSFISHPRIIKIIGDSTSEKVVQQVKKIVKNKTAMVILDSDHSKIHVLKEMEIYSKFVSTGNYLIVEDTNINGHPVLSSLGEGPMEAVKEFLQKEKSFKIDGDKEKFFLTFSPKGFLKRQF